MNIFSVSFFGHRQIDNPLQIELQLEEIISSLLKREEYIEFLVGRDGEFDQLVSSTIRRCKRRIRDDNNALIWVMPYPTAEFRDNEDSFRDYYDEIEICEQAATTHYKSAFQIRNRVMVDRSDLVILYVEHPSGGAYQTFRYVQKSGKNLSIWLLKNSQSARDRRNHGEKTKFIYSSYCSDFIDCSCILVGKIKANGYRII